MAINLQLAWRFDIERGEDPMGRDWVGYHPTLSPDALFNQNRGMWYLGEGAFDEQYVTFAYDSEVVGVGEIERIETLPWPKPDRRRDKQVIIGQALQPGHPAYDYFIGRPVESRRNPVSYMDDLEPRSPGNPVHCACGCGSRLSGKKTFVQGHDQKAIHSRIAEGWGDTVGFIKWFDSEYRKAT